MADFGELSRAVPWANKLALFLTADFADWGQIAVIFLFQRTYAILPKLTLALFCIFSSESIRLVFQT